MTMKAFSTMLMALLAAGMIAVGCGDGNSNSATQTTTPTNVQTTGTTGTSGGVDTTQTGTATRHPGAYGAALDACIKRTGDPAGCGQSGAPGSP